MESKNEDDFHEYQANLFHTDLMRYQEGLRYIEKFHNQELQKHKEM